MKKNFTQHYINEFTKTLNKLDFKKIDRMAIELSKIRRRNGRLFLLGVGGSAGNATHAVNDFRKLCDIECYSPIDNVSELTARINDEGWETCFVNWLKVSKLNKKDALLVFSVGGGNVKKKVSVNLVEAIKFAKKQKSKVFGLVGRKDGFLYKYGDVSIETPLDDQKLMTPISEAFQPAIWHCLVSHPALKVNKTKW